MADIDTSQNFADGDTVTGAKLNNIIDGATILPAFITAKVAKATPAADDLVVIYDSAGTTLKKARVDAIPGVASVAMTTAIPGTSVTVTNPSGPAVAVAINQLPQSGNVILASPPGGASGTPFYRHIIPKDMVTGIPNIPAWLIDWSISVILYKGISASGTFTFTGGTDGQTVRVLLQQGGSFTVGWPPGIRWENGIIPTLSLGAGRVDIFEFSWLGTITYGKRILTNAFAP